MRTFKYFILPLLFLSLFQCKSIEEEDIIQSNSKTELLIKNATIFNGKDSLLFKGMDVWLKNGLIDKIGKNISFPAGIKIIDGKGKTLMPGLIDSHVHLSGSGSVPWENYGANEEYNLQAYLYSGITTVYDLGGLANGISKLAKKVENQEILGPDIFNTHIPISIKNSHPIPLTKLMLPWPLKKMVNGISPIIDEPSEAEKLMENYLKNDIDYVKISCDQIPEGSPEMNFDQLKALINQAHLYDKKVFVHVGSPENAVNAVLAGADILAHGVWRGKLNPEQADIIAKSATPIIYTLAGFHNISEIHQGKFKPNELDKKLVNKKILDPVSEENGQHVHGIDVMGEFFEDAFVNSKFWKSNFNLLKDRGVIMLVGTDSNLPGTYAGSTYFQEIDLLSEYGLSNFDILRGATFLNSKLFLEKPMLFSELLLKGREEQYLEAEKSTSDVVFFDRGIPDVYVYMDYLGSDYPPIFKEKCNQYLYTKVFMCAPWEEIYKSDNERYETFEQAVKIDTFLKDAYQEIGLGIDFTARDLQTKLKEKGLPWEKAKGFDGAAVIGKWLPKESLGDTNNINFSLLKNGEEVQKSNTGLMLWKIDELISYVSTFFMLKKGDIIFTGTPSGVGKIQANDYLSGVLQNQEMFSVKIK